MDNVSVIVNVTIPTAITMQDDAGLNLPLPLRIFLGLLLSILAILTVVSNTIVVVAIARIRSLRTITNSLIVSLAIADLIMGLITMPLAIVNDIAGGQWYLGHIACDFWMATEILSGTASIMNLSMISLERYIAIQYPLTHRWFMSSQTAAGMIAFAWIIPLGMSYPCIVWWHSVKISLHRPAVCTFTDDGNYILMVVSLSFFIPSIIMIFVYVMIFRTVTNQINSLRSGRLSVSKSKSNGDQIEMRIHHGGAFDKCNVDEPGAITEGRTDMSDLRNEYRAVKMLSIVLGAFVFAGYL
ncbi:dopamine receptor 2-like [Saccoglossus kowalevskii]|uniref:Dopamine receptor 2-like n=1 Tax=Saccoglossus kowalevskii TaxID=10224 RepID=A0ABM0MJA0_SACKO|nr:PREDICTED: dopamine receptor 2-like [Saccoglossus kowalevskii]